MSQATDAAAAAAKRVADTAAEEAAREAAVLNKSERANFASEIVLVKSVAELDDLLESVGSVGGRRKEVLVQQFDARLARPGFIYPAKPLKGLPKDGATGIAAEVAHLRSQVVKMIEADLAAGRDLGPLPPDRAAGPVFKRPVPVPPAALRSLMSTAMEAEDKARTAAGAVQDDPELVALEAQYLNKKFTDPPVWDGQKGSGKQRKVARERFVVHEISWSEERKQWLAGCVLLGSGDTIPAGCKTAMGTVLRSAVVPYILTSLDVMLD